MPALLESPAAASPLAFVTPLFTSEVARILEVAPETVRNYDRTGRLPARRSAGGVRLWDPRDVEAFKMHKMQRGGR